MKVKPGVLPETMPILPLKRVSPSRFTALKECALREVWIAARQPALLPAPPATRLGSVIHQLLEESGRGQIDKGDAEKRWKELVSDVEQRMRESWLERSLAPLRKTVLNYEVRKIRACRKAVEIAQEPSLARHKIEGRAEIGFEVWVESPNGLIGGYVDQVQKTDEGAVLRDYKSGYILDKQSPDGELKIKNEYQVQLKLYAALYQSTFGRWPVRLEIVPLQGANQILTFHPQECTKLLEDAADSLKQINQAINEITVSSATGNEHLLATPSPATCRFCQFRPGCSAYQKASDQAAGDQWPKDIWGTVTEIRQLGNGRIGASLQVTNRPYTVAHIRGLEPSPDRHPALQLIKQGDRIAVYNLQGSASAISFSETPITVIYQVQHP